MRTDLDTLAAFEVKGIPAPQGSKSLMPNGHLIEGSSATGRARHKSWRTDVTKAAAEVRADQPHDGPLAVTITFRVPMPKSRPAADRRRGWKHHSVKPDIDKLLRSTLDALVDGRLIADDGRICEISAVAREVTGWTGAEIIVHRLLDEAAA